MLAFLRDLSEPCLLQRSTPARAAAAAHNKISRSGNNTEWLNWNWTRLRAESQPAQAYFLAREDSTL